MRRRISMIPYLSIFHFLQSSLDFDTSQRNCLSLLMLVQSLRTFRELGSSADLKQRWYLKMSVRVDGRRITSNLCQPIKQQTSHGFIAEVNPINISRYHLIIFIQLSLVTISNVIFIKKYFLVLFWSVGKMFHDDVDIFVRINRKNCQMVSRLVS